jgi:hypothetical protein
MISSHPITIHNQSSIIITPTYFCNFLLNIYPFQERERERERERWGRVEKTREMEKENPNSLADLRWTFIDSFSVDPNYRVPPI